MLEWLQGSENIVRTRDGHARLGIVYVDQTRGMHQLLAREPLLHADIDDGANDAGCHGAIDEGTFHARRTRSLALGRRRSAKRSGRAGRRRSSAPVARRHSD